MATRFARLAAPLLAGATMAFGIDGVRRARLEARSDSWWTTAVAYAASMKPRYVDIEKDVFAGVSQEYDDLGQIEVDEAPLTVQDHAFTQIGIVEPDGVVSLIDKLNIGAGDVFCDIGSGVGNICMQVLCDSACRSVCGVEIIPSRNRHAEEAFSRGQERYPTIFGEGREGKFWLGDVVKSGPFLQERGVTVLFTHSWMFDDELMGLMVDVLDEVPTLRAIVTSRPLPDWETDAHSKTWEHSTATFSADWNPESPFHVYRRK